MNTEGLASTEHTTYQLPNRIAKHVAQFPAESDTKTLSDTTFDSYAANVKHHLENNIQPQIDIAYSDRDHLSKFIAVENKRNPGLNLQYYSTHENFISSLTKASRSHRGIIALSLETSRPRLKPFSHHIACDVKRHPDGRMTVVFLEPGSFKTLHYKASSGISSLKRRVDTLTNNRSVIIETGVQQAPLGCDLHSLSFALKSHKHPDPISHIHDQILHSSPDNPHQPFLSYERFARSNPINFTPLDGTRFLTAPYYKHATSPSFIDQLPDDIRNQRVNSHKRLMPETLVQRVNNPDFSRMRINNEKNTVTTYSTSLESFRAQEIARLAKAGHLSENSALDHTKHTDPSSVMVKHFFSDAPHHPMTAAEESLISILDRIPDLTNQERNHLLGILSLTSGRDADRAAMTLLHMQRDFKVDFENVLSTKNADALNEPLRSYHHFLHGSPHVQDNDFFSTIAKDVWWTHTELQGVPEGERIIKKLQTGEPSSSSQTNRDKNIVSPQALSDMQMQSIFQGVKVFIRDDQPLSDRDFGLKGAIGTLMDPEACSMKDNLQAYYIYEAREALKYKGILPKAVEMTRPKASGFFQKTFNFLQPTPPTKNWLG